MPPPEPWVLSWENLALMPVCHYRLEYAELVRQRFRIAPPDALAIELPAHLANAFLIAVKRLPEISILLYQAPSGRTIYLPLEPVDPFVEAARLALERDIPVHLVDINLEEAYPPFHDPFPDPYALFKIGSQAFYNAFEQKWQSRISEHPLDIRREKGMAYNLQRIAKTYQTPLFLCGMIHGKGVLQHLEEPQATPLQPTHPPPVQIFHLHPSCLDEVMASFPFLSALYETRRRGLPPEPEIERFTVRRRFQIQSHPFLLLGREGPQFDEHAALNASLDRVARRAGFQGDTGDPPGPMDRNRMHLFLFEEARRHLREETGEEIKAWQKKIFWKFARNYALLEGLLLPDGYHLLVAARASVDDNFCHAFLRLSRFYPWQKESSTYPTLRVSGEDVWLGTRKLRVRRWYPHKKRVLPRPMRKTRKGENYPGEWLESFDGNALCSYPPEDIVVEDYGKVVRERWARILRDQQSQSEPFITSFEDGIDIRETLRKRWEKRIYVKNPQKTGGRAGAVVVVFDNDEQNSNYPYKMTWLGEHEQESDMAFYATLPEENIIGPGICRCEYGGFLMIWPPRRLYDVWKDPDYRFFTSKSEVLLAAGLDYSLERWVVYLASHPPHSSMRTLAERLRRQIVYIPLGSLSSSRLKKIRAFHILSGYDKRKIAKDYIV